MLCIVPSRKCRTGSWRPRADAFEQTRPHRDFCSRSASGGAKAPDSSRGPKDWRVGDHREALLGDTSGRCVVLRHSMSEIRANLHITVGNFGDRYFGTAPGHRQLA